VTTVARARVLPRELGATALLPLGAVVAVGALLRFWALGHQSFWYDEIVTTLAIKGSFWHVVKGVRTWESSPPLYHLIAWLWTRPFGVTEVGLRSLSAVFGTATVVVAWAAGREAVSERAGLIAAGVVAVNPMLVWYSQDARPYALLALLGATTVWLALRIVRTPTRRRFVAWSVVSCLALLTHYFAAFLLIGEFVALMWLMPADRRSVAIAFMPVVVVGLALVPLAHAEDADGRAAWISGIGLGTRAGHIGQELVTANTSLISSNSAAPYGLWWVLGLLGVLGSIAIGLVSAVARHSRVVGAVAAAGLGTIVIPLLLALTPLDYLIERNVIAAWPVLAITLGCLLALSWRPVAAAALAMIAIAGIAVNIEVQRTPALQRTNWRAAAHALTPSAFARAVIVKPDYSYAVLAHYGVPLVPLTVGARVSEVVEVGMGLPASQPAPPGATSQPPLHWPDLTVLTVRTLRPITITRALLAEAGQPLLLEPSVSGLHWFYESQSLLVRWYIAAKDATGDREARTILVQAPAALRRAKLGNPPPEVPSASTVLARLRQIAQRAAQLGANPDSPNRTAFNSAVAQFYARR
jgi:4-amino-4-deoxy-L-arabinose transferase-like glycosyltransferase